MEETTKALETAKKLEPKTKSNSLQDENSNKPPDIEVKDQPEESDSEEWESFEEDQFECFCGETFVDEDDIIVHRSTKHPNLSYNCKLCDVKLSNENDHDKHRMGDHHRNLSLQLKLQFESRISSQCDECRISEVKSDTNYYFCENDCHEDIFHLIWNQVKTGSKAD